MSKRNISPLSREQWIGAAIILVVTIAAWLVVALWPQKDAALPDGTVPRTDYDSLRQARWEKYTDSVHRADDARFDRWTAERNQRFDSFDCANRAAWAAHRERMRQEFDSVKRADSLWRDSVGWFYPKQIKRDTILDLNRCDTAELQLIRGIGRYTAVKILRYREALGGYYSPAQLTDEEFNGLHLDTLLHHFTASAEDVRTIDVNSCSIDRLNSHPYLRYSQAKAIYEYRRKKIRLHSVEELENLPELDKNDINRIKFYFRFDN